MTMLATRSADPSAPGVRSAKKADASRLLTTLTLAFAADPVVRWVFPEAEQYLSVFPRFAEAFGGGAVPLGTAFLSEGGAALWLPPGATPDEKAIAAVMEESVPAAHLETINEVFGELDRYHPHEPHWYLPLLGVDPARQGEGHGSALLSQALRQCDEARLPAYLEATSERNAALYRRHGFEPLGEIRAGGCPPLIPMLRPAR